jgi:hypothetical protein
MGVQNLEVGYTSATTRRGDHEVHKGHVVALGEKKTRNRFSRNRTGFEKVVSECVLHVGLNMWCQKKTVTDNSNSTHSTPHTNKTSCSHLLD